MHKIPTSKPLQKATRKRDIPLRDQIDPRKDTCALDWAQGVSVGSKFYIDGGLGWYKSNTTGEMFGGPNMFLHRLDLIEPNEFSSFAIGDLKRPVELLERNEKVPETFGGHLWYNDKSLYLLPGQPDYSGSARDWPGFNGYDHDTVVDLWRYKIENDTWEMVQHNPMMTDSQGQQLPVPRLRWAFSTTVGNEAQKKAYIISGEKHNEDSNVMEGMVVYDFVKESWSLKQTPWKARNGGLVVHLPLGRGYLLAFSGLGTSGYPEFPLSEIQIYDLSSEQWLEPQSATAANERDGIPSPRQHACVVIAETTLGWYSWNIYVYGGSHPTREKHYDDVWVLNIPSFKWILVSPEFAINGPGGRAAMSCGIVSATEEQLKEGRQNGRFMVVYGGSSSDDSNLKKCDPAGNITWIYDLYSLQWKDRQSSTFQLSDNYGVPQEINFKLGGIGRTDRKYDPPEEGFANGEMETDVKTHYGEYSKKDSKLQSWQLTIIIVCALIAVFLLIYAVAWYFKRRKSRSTKQKTMESDG